MPDSLHHPLSNAPTLAMTSTCDLILRKWGLQREIAAINAEIAARDARAVDEACALKGEPLNV